MTSFRRSEQRVLTLAVYYTARAERAALIES
jgi:hypothetical protein